MEIEHKFLIVSDGWRMGDAGRRITQGYLCTDPDRVVRVRIYGEEAFMTVKGRAKGITRTEIEFRIEMQHARELMGMCLQPVIDKTRHEVLHEGMLWEVDVFHGENEGLVVAEIELTSEDAVFVKPEWVGAEVSHDLKYSNSRLVERPFQKWSEAERQAHEGGGVES